MTRARRDPATFIRGADVVIPARLARPILATLVPALSGQVRASGHTLRVPDEVLGLLEALHAVDVAHDRGPMSAIGHRPDVPATVEGMRSPDDAGRAVGMSARQVRRLCATGHVAHQRVGARALLVDVDSLRDHLRGRAHG